MHAKFTQRLMSLKRASNVDGKQVHKMNPDFLRFGQISAQCHNLFYNSTELHYYSPMHSLYFSFLFTTSRDDLLSVFYKAHIVRPLMTVDAELKKLNTSDDIKLTQRKEWKNMDKPDKDKPITFQIFLIFRIVYIHASSVLKEKYTSCSREASQSVLSYGSLLF